MNNKGKDLAIFFDASHNTGYCVLAAKNGCKSIQKAGVFKLDKSIDTGSKYVRFADFVAYTIRNAIETNRVSKKLNVCVAYERGFMRSLKTVEFLFGLNAIIRMEAAAILDPVSNKVDYNCKCYSPLSIKKYITGNGFAGKEEVIEAVNKEHGLNISDDNIADAIAGASLALSI